MSVASGLLLPALDCLPRASVTVFDRDLTVVLARGDGFRVFGLDPDSLEGRPAGEVLAAPRWSPYLPACQAALEGRTTAFQVDSDDNAYRVLVRVGPVRDGTGTVVGGVAVATDVSAEHAALVRVAEAEEQVRLVLAHTADAIVQYARDGTILWVTPAFERLFGYRADEVVGTRLRLTPDGQGDDVAEAVLAAIRTRRDRATVRALLQAQDGRTIWCDVTTTIVWTADLSVDFTVSVFHDASALVSSAETLEAAMGRYRLLAENAYDAVLQVDSAGRISWASPSVAAVVGRTAESLVGWRIVDLILAEDLRRLSGLRDAAADDASSTSLSARIRRPDGATMWVRVRERAIRPDGVVVTGHVITLTNVDEEVAARAALSEAEGLLHAATHGPGVATSVVGRDGRFISVNAAWSEYTGCSEMEASGLTLWDLMADDDVAEDRERFADLLAGNRDFYRIRVRSVGPDGSLRLGQVTRSAVRGRDGSVRFVLSQTVDVTAEHDARRELDYQRQHDPLTLLPTSAWLVAVLERELPALAGTGGMALFLLDIDDFTVVNDSLGHGVGDHALRVIADRLRSAVRPDDHVGRFGGDSFLLVLHGISSHDEATRVAARIRDAVAADLDLDGHHLAPSVSTGITLAKTDSSAGSLLGEADAALARAKAIGRGHWQFFDESMRADALERLTLEDEIRQGLAGGQFAVHYQPIVSLADGRVVGHEALVRWHHPTRGLLLPGAFLPVAEQSGLVVGVGDTVLRTVVDTLARRPDLPGTISVNVSGVQLRDSERLPDIVGALREADVDPRRLVLEITETAALLLGDEARLALSRVTATGIGLHVDDFGTGYSSVALLRDLPVTGLKLDMSFVAAVTGPGGRAAALTSGLAGLARGLGLEGIAEGVETPVQAEVLRSQGWRCGQGYLFARPGPDPVTEVGWAP